MISNAAEMYEQELLTPVVITDDTVLRAKITDACGLSCTFCHNEGTPVASSGQPVAFPTRGSRVSIYADDNGVNFMPGTMQPGSAYDNALDVCGDALAIDEVHFTGGEPTLHPNLVGLVEAARAKDWTVKITSNGETGAKHIGALAEAGVSKINFSIFGTTPQELAQTQHSRYQKSELARRKIDALKDAVDACDQFGLRADMNLVVRGSQDFDRVERLIESFGGHANIRLLNDLGEPDAEMAIYSFLGSLAAVPVQRYITAGASGARTSFTVPGVERGVQVKKIRQTRLPQTCAGCQFNQDCTEGFYGVRLYTDNIGRYLVGVCIRRMDLTLGLQDFAASAGPAEVLKYRKDDRIALEKQYNEFIRKEA